MIYIGGILVLIIFGVILTMNITGVDVKSGRLGKLQIGAAGILTAVIAISLIMVFRSADWFQAESKPYESQQTRLAMSCLPIIFWHLRQPQCCF